MLSGSSREPSMSIVPRDGFMPTTPQHAAGMRIDPPPSLPCANGTTPAATNAPAPPDDPPAERVGSHGLRHGGRPSGSGGAGRPRPGVPLLPAGTLPVRAQRAA